MLTAASITIDSECFVATSTQLLYTLVGADHSLAFLATTPAGHLEHT